MARPTKSAPKVKEPIRLRQKALANGNKSLYLDIYRNGKRSYEFLKLYLIPGTDHAAKTANENTLRAANAIKAQKLIELANDQAGISSTSSRSKMLLVDWVETFIKRHEEKAQSAKYPGLTKAVLRHLKEYMGNSAVRLRDVDKHFCLGFIKALHGAEQHRGKGKARLAASTIRAYVQIFNNVINAAVREEILPSNPMAKIDAADMPQQVESTREHLSIEELRAMISAPCGHEGIKRAFLFSCFCGLRYSDVAGLTWANIFVENGQTYAKVVMKKTRRMLQLPLSEEAVKWLPARAAADERIFALPHVTSVSPWLKKWANAAGLTKKITFHVSRHTFATLMLTVGADLYTTSKLLGHANVTTTQIYAKIVDAKKAAAVNLVNGMFNTQEDRI